MKRAIVLGLVLALFSAIVVVQPAAADEGRAARFQFGSDIDISEDEVVDGDVVAFGGDIVVDGIVEGNVSALGGRVEVAGEVRGDVVAIGGDVVLEPSAVIAGSAAAVGGEVQRASGAVVRGAVTSGGPDFSFIEKDFTRAAAAWPFDSSFGALNLIVNVLRGLAFAALLALGALLSVAIFPTQVTVVERTILQAPWPSIGVGLLTAILLALASLPLACTCIGLVLAVLGYTGASLFGLTALGAIIGNRVLRATGWRAGSYLLTALVGVLIIWVASIVPCLGGLLMLIASWIAVGAVVLSRFGTIAPPFSWQGPRPIPPTPPREQ